MFGGHATSCVRHAVADLTVRWEEVCLSFGHYWLHEHWLTTVGSSHCRQSTRRVKALDRRIHVSPFISIWCRASRLSVSMAFECRADIHSVRASGCCRPDSPLGGGLLRFATVPDRCILVYHVDRVRHQEEGTSLSLVSASHCMVWLGSLSWFHRPSHSSSVMRSSVATNPWCIPGCSRTMANRIAQRDLCCLFWF